MDVPGMCTTLANTQPGKQNGLCVTTTVCKKAFKIKRKMRQNQNPSPSGLVTRWPRVLSNDSRLI